MTLRAGKISNKELAEWFGITPNSLCKNKAKKLEELKSFASYHIDIKNHIIIDEVYRDTYEKNNYKERIIDNIDKVWSPSGLDSCSRVSEEIQKIITEENQQFNLKPTTIYAYTREGRNELYGKPFLNEGKLGSCVYLWCKKDEDGSYSMLTEEEQKIKQDLQIKYFGDATEKQILVKAMIEAGELSSEEAWDVLEELTNMRTGNFMEFLRELQEKLQCKVVRGTMVTRRLEDGNG